MVFRVAGAPGCSGGQERDMEAAVSVHAVGDTLMLRVVNETDG